MKKVLLRYGDDYIAIELPDSADVLSTPKIKPLPQGERVIRAASILSSMLQLTAKKD